MATLPNGIGGGGTGSATGAVLIKDDRNGNSASKR
jgi:hypothetical protein